VRLRTAYVVVNLLFVCATAAGAELPHDLSKWVPAKFHNARNTPVIVVPYLPGESLGAFDPLLNRIFILPPNPNDPTPDETLAHEVGHAIWFQDLSVWQKRAWCKQHNRELARGKDMTIAVMVYPTSCAHSFAEAFGEYETEPKVMRSGAIEVYLFFRLLTGSEPFNN
jgi:hypothetical protein